MKKTLITLAWIIWSRLYITSQITVTSSTFPVIGDRLRYIQAANPNSAISLFTPPGGNQSWNLSGLTASSKFEYNFKTPKEGKFSDLFPGASSISLKGTDEYYYKSSNTKFELLGIVSTAIAGQPIKAVYINQPPYVERYGVLNFFDIHQQSNSNLLSWAYSEIPAGVINLANKIDSIRFRISNQVIETVDAYGNLRLPGSLPQSDFPVLRLKETTYHEQRIDAKVPPLGWIDITDNITGSASPWAILFGVDTVTRHRYISQISKEEIAILTFNSAQNEVKSVVYKNTEASTPTAELASPKLPSLQIYPNPASASITIHTSQLIHGPHQLKIFTIGGALIHTSKHLISVNGSIKILLRPGMKGEYICKLENEKGELEGISRLLIMQ